jgi:hypothetical protein
VAPLDIWRSASQVAAQAGWRLLNATYQNDQSGLLQKTPVHRWTCRERRDRWSLRLEHRRFQQAPAA